jgi:hypothetical protein
MNNLYCNFELMKNKKLLQCTNCGYVIQLKDKNKQYICHRKLISASINQKDGVKFIKTETVDLNLQSNKKENQENISGNKCSQYQIDSRLEICNGCEFYQNNTCLKCGCSLSRDKTFMNKLYWTDQSCPIGKWGPVPPEES